MIQSSGDSYAPSHILPSARDVGQSWKSDPGLGEDFEAPVDGRLVVEVPGLAYRSPERASLLPLVI